MPVKHALRLIVTFTVALALVACTGAPSPSISASPSEAPSAAPSLPASPASPSASASSSADVTVVGVDYAFEEMPDSVTAGTTLGFRNDGAELHEMLVFRKNDDVPQSFEELLALPEDEALQFVTEKGVAFAEPGQAAAETVTVDEAGDYLMVCFIPVGTTTMPSTDPGASGEPSLPSGPPHVAEGMFKTFTVGG
jgi:plastocyanin